MSEYIPPCINGTCDFMPSTSESVHSQQLCRDIAKCVVGAGGASLLETTICPFKAMYAVGPEQSDPAMTEIRSGLGITGFFEGPLEQ